MDNLRGQGGHDNDGQNTDGRRIDRRSEARTAVNLALMVWGVDIEGERFLQEAHAHDISRSGALLSGLDAELKSGDVIGILYAGRKARYRIVWVRYDEAGDRMQAAVHRFAHDECPWQELLSVDPNISSAQVDSEASQGPT